jgi:hypothetical protein
LLGEALNDLAPAGKAWRVYGREILDQLARQSNLATDLLEDIKISRPGLLVDFFRSLTGKNIPSGYEVRNRITTLVRGLAFQGYAIVVGQGGAGATHDLDNGLSIRLEAPLDWRVGEVAKREAVTPEKARQLIEEMEQQREYLRHIYRIRFPRDPGFDITYDASRFTLSQIAQHVVYMMKLRHLV